MTFPKLLITGSNGLIGTILKKGLENKFDVYGCDRDGPFSDRVYDVNIRSYDQLLDVFSRLGPCDSVIHLAGNPNVDALWDSALKDNIEGTRNVFEAARKTGVKRIVFASSNHVTGAYEKCAPRMISIHDPILPDSFYGVSKASGEALAGYYALQHGIVVICLRIGSVLKNDDPGTDKRSRRTWLSHRDLVQLVERSLIANVKFGIYYGVSNNEGAFWDISNARSDLGYKPLDDASTR